MMFWAGLIFALIIGTAVLKSLGALDTRKDLLQWFIFVVVIEIPVVIGYLLVNARLSEANKLFESIGGM